MCVKSQITYFWPHWQNAIHGNANRISSQKWFTERINSIDSGLSISQTITPCDGGIYFSAAYNLAHISYLWRWKLNYSIVILRIIRTFLVDQTKLILRDAWILIGNRDDSDAAYHKTNWSYIDERKNMK